MTEFEKYIDERKKLGAVDRDGFYGCQCMDLWNDYCEKCLNLTGVGASVAKKVLDNPIVQNNFEIIKNFPEFITQAGDAAVFTGNDTGHISIVLSADIKKFKSLDQNWQPQQLTEEIHSYFDLAPIYFLRPKNREPFQEKKESSYRYSIGQKVRFSTCYRSAYDEIGWFKAIPAGKMYKNYGTITRIEKGSNNPYLLDDGMCWVNDGDIREVL